MFKAYASLLVLNLKLFPTLQSSQPAIPELILKKGRGGHVEEPQFHKGVRACVRALGGISV